ncbi:MAG: 3-deoxy-D-manno-octulosonic acid transferase [Bacteroidales bacterium]|nr:3-deoxy-D-manno-octulosonic acid transferase [Bacteroidales bacterium]
MRLLYNLFILLYWVAAHCASVKSRKARLWVNGRKNILRQLSLQSFSNENVIWVHCASLGEFEQGRPLIEYLKQKQSSCKILLTFFSPSGFEIQKNYPQADYICYLPNDTPSNARRFIEIVQPKYIFFIKYDFWYNYIREAYRQHIPFYSVSCIFSHEQFYFAWHGAWFRKQLRQISCFFTQDQFSVELLRQYRIPQAVVFGDTRFDRVAKLVSDAKPIAVFADMKRQENMIVAGSTWTNDEKLLARLIKEHSFRLILAPHEVHEAHIEEIERCFEGCSMIRYSQLCPNTSVENIQLIIIDTIGILNSLYRYGDIAYVGGGFGKGIHNILEAATYGKPIVFGTNYKKFKEAKDLIGLSAAFSVANYVELDLVITQLFADKDNLQSIGMRAKQYVSQHTGACEQIYNFVFIS